MEPNPPTAGPAAAGVPPDPPANADRAAVPARGWLPVPPALKRAVIFSALYLLFVVYPPLRLLGLLFEGWQPGTATLMWIMVFPVGGRLLHELWSGRASRAICAVSMTWAGACFLVWALLMPWELINLVLDLPARTSGGWLLGIAVALVAAGFVNAQRISVREIELKRNAGTGGLRFVQLSDIHVGSRGAGFLDRIVERTLALAPDYVLITGDLLDARDVTRRELAPLARFEVPVYFAIGNHERYVDLDGVVDTLRSLGVRVLRNRSVVDGPLQIIGIDDAEDRDQVERQMAHIPVRSDRYTVLMYHRPEGLEAAAAAGVDLMLSGHTHNGQIVPFNLLVKRTFPRIRGLYRSGRTRLYVSPGSGTWGPVLRLGSRNEVTHFRLG